MPEDHIFCPSCNEETAHLVIKSGQEILVKCADCESTHSIQKSKEGLASIKAIVNRDDTSQPYHINLPAQEILKVGNELLVDDPAKDVVLTEITALDSDRRVEEALARDIKTVWARAIDDVTLRASVYRKGTTRSLRSPAFGEEILEVGEIMEIEGIRFKITKIKLRGEGFADRSQAKNILRLWGREL